VTWVVVVVWPVFLCLVARLEGASGFVSLSPGAGGLEGGGGGLCD
jgi:hypothetical protein